jgi:glycosyltransferase involved in cell wall biosynthesis
VSSAHTPLATRIAICVCTFRRSHGLDRLLAGLAGLEFCHNARPEIVVVVVDNDLAPLAEPVVDGWRPRFPWQLDFRHEPRRGLVWARNACLEAVPETADWIAFIDDDEWPEVQWLDELLAVARREHAEIVGGPVRPRFAAPVPGWIERGGFFEIGPYRDGTPTTFIATNNALVSAAAVRRHGWRFSPVFNFMGGEDQHFFLRAVEQDCRAVTAGGAIVWETVSPDRTNARWLLRRKFRMGTTLATIDLLRSNGWSPRLRRVGKAAGRIALGCCQLPLALPGGKAGLVKALGNAAWGLGSLAGLLGVRYQEYAPRRGEAGGPDPPPVPGSAGRAPERSVPPR